METWQEEINRGFLSVPEGVSIIEVFDTPDKRTNNYGKEQWLFEDAKVNGEVGSFTPPAGILRLISRVLSEQDGKYPVKMKVKRVGMDIKSSFILITDLDGETE